MSVTSLMAEGLFPQINLQPRLGPLPQSLWHSSDIVGGFNRCGDIFWHQTIHVNLPTPKHNVTVQARRLLSALESGDTAPLLQCFDCVCALIAFCAITTPHPTISVEVTRLRRGDWSCTLLGVSWWDHELKKALVQLANCQWTLLSDDLVPVLAPVVHCLGGIVWPDGTAVVPRQYRLVNYVPRPVGRLRRQGSGQMPRRMRTPGPAHASATVTLVAQDGERVKLQRHCLAGCDFFACASNFREGRTGHIGLPCDGATLRALAAHAQNTEVPVDYDVPLLELGMYLLWDDLVDACLAECVASGRLDAVALARLARHPGLPPASAALVQGIVRGQRAAMAAHVYARMALQSRI